MKIKLENISFKYNNQEEYILKDVNCEIKNSMTFILGENGSGKTTLTNLLNGIYSPSFGQILIDDENIKEIKTLKHDVSVVYQFSDSQLFNLTVKEDLLYPFRKKEEKKKEVIKEIYKYFELFDLPQSLLEVSPFKLSGGEKKKICIISSLILNPKVLILDEPTIGLDNESKLTIYKVLENISKRILVIIISHDYEQVYKYAKDIIKMEDRTIKPVISKEDYFESAYNEGKNILLTEKLRICKYLGFDYKTSIQIKETEMKEHIYKRVLKGKQ